MANNGSQNRLGQDQPAQQGKTEQLDSALILRPANAGRNAMASSLSQGWYDQGQPEQQGESERPGLTLAPTTASNAANATESTFCASASNVDAHEASRATANNSLAVHIGARSGASHIATSKSNSEKSCNARLFSILEPLALLTVPAALVICAVTNTDQSALLTLAATLCAVAVFFAGWETSRPQLRHIMPTVVLGALAAAGRILFAPIPDFKPVSAICIIAGATLGRRSGFMVGALAALVSNFFFGQGAWTPWQMYSWGLIGYLAGVLAPKGIFEKTPVLLAFGFLSAMLYGLLLNGWYVIGFVRPITLPSTLAAYAAGFPLDCVHGVATVVFLSALYIPWRRKLERISTKFNLMQR